MAFATVDLLIGRGFMRFFFTIVQHVLVNRAIAEFKMTCRTLNMQGVSAFRILGIFQVGFVVTLQTTFRDDPLFRIGHVAYATAD